MSLRRALGNAKKGPDFCMTIALDIMKREHRTRTCGEPGDGAFHVDPLVHVRRCDRAVVHDIHSGEIGGDLDTKSPATATPHAFEDGVDSDPMKPGGKTTLAPIRRQSLPDPHEDILHQLLGLATVPAQAQAQRENTPGVGVVQRGKCCLVAALCRAYRGVDQDLTGERPGLELERCV